MKVQIKRGANKPQVSQLENYQLGFDYTKNDLYIKNPNVISGDQIVYIGGESIYDEISGEIATISGFVDQVYDTISGHIENDPQVSGDGVWTEVSGYVLSLTDGAKNKINQRFSGSVLDTDGVTLKFDLTDGSTVNTSLSGLIIDDGTWD
jgi:hypothetical protein